MNRVALALALLAVACGSTSQSNEQTRTDSLGMVFRVTGDLVATVGVPITFTVAALDRSGSVNPTYRGSVEFLSDDAEASLPADVTFSPADDGVKVVTVVFNNAGIHSLGVSDHSRGGGIGWCDVRRGTATQLVLTQLPSSATAGSLLTGQVTALDKHGNAVKDFTGTVRFTSTDVAAVLPPDTTFTREDRGTRTFPFQLVSAGTRSITAVQVGSAAGAGTANVTVVNGPAARISLEGLPASVAVDTDVTVTVTVRDAFGNPAKDYAGRVHFIVTDPAATAPADVTFTTGMAGTADVRVRFATEGDQSLIATDSILTGSAAISVRAGAAAGYALSPLPTSALAGEPLSLNITAVDAHGNTVRNYAGSAAVTSVDASDRLPAPGGFSNGVRSVSLAFVSSGPHFATVREVSGTIHADTTTVNIVSADAVLFLVSGGTATAGAPAATSVTAKDTFGNTVASYSGSVSFSSSDPGAVLPAAFSFGAGDAGQHTFSVTFRTAGAQSIAVTDGRASGSASFAVAAGAAVACDLIDFPGSAAAGAQVGLRVVVKDAFANLASGYTGTVSLTSTDAAAQLGAPASFTATDAGVHAFTVQLRTAGSQTVTAGDLSTAGLTCQATTTVVPGAAVLAVAFAQPDAWAGTAVNATVTAQDTFANRISTYAGTVAFTSSDVAAVKPANVTFAAGDNGQKTVSVTFNTIGAQTFTATDTVALATTGTGSQNVHGLVYTNPASGGKVRLVASAASNASLVQLDLVSNTSLFPLTAGTNDTVRNGVFAAGMNLPLDATKVGADAAPIVTASPAGSTAVLVLGAAPQAVAAALSSGVHYSGISQKRVDTTAGAAAGNMRGDVAVRPFPGGNSFYYSIRLRLTPGAASGTVFDGQSLGSKFRAAVRDRSGTDVFAGTADFAIGKLEVR